MRILVLGALAATLGWTVALADPPPPDAIIESTLAPDMEQQVIVGPTPPGFDLSLCNATLWSPSFYLAFYSQNGFELMDDLHTTAHGTEMLCKFEIGFYNLGFTPTDAIVTIYDNDAADGLPGKILAGPFIIHGLPVGLVRATYPADFGVVDEHVWMGVRFSAFRATGLTVAGPYARGSSHDVAYSPRYGYVNFGGVDQGYLPANFIVGVASQPPVPVLSRTWGELKATYR